jgi:hypothetical protein
VKGTIKGIAFLSDASSNSSHQSLDGNTHAKISGANVS